MLFFPPFPVTDSLCKCVEMESAHSTTVKNPEIESSQAAEHREAGPSNLEIQSMPAALITFSFYASHISQD